MSFASNVTIVFSYIHDLNEYLPIIALPCDEDLVLYLFRLGKYPNKISDSSGRGVPPIFTHNVIVLPYINVLFVVVRRGITLLGDWCPATQCTTAS